MQIIENPEMAEWTEIIRRPVQDNKSLTGSVRDIMDAVRTEGDKAVARFSKQFDKSERPNRKLEAAEIAEAASLVPDKLKAALATAKKNIETFHRSQQLPEPVIVTMPGVSCWRKSVGIETVGLYIPGGTAPLFSTVLMLGIPAVLAGCRRIILCSPPTPEGKLHPAIIYAATLAGITEIFAVGGVQAIAAMAFGTESVPRVDKIFGPGNQFVTCAKQLLQQDGVAIDMPAGPSEVAVYADENADPGFVAADLLSQCEHGPDSQVMLVCRTNAFAGRVAKEMERQLETLPRAAVARLAMDNSRAVVFPALSPSMEFINRYAPEHLILACEDAPQVAALVRNAGSVFLGHYTPESAGDYASGTNHTLPTNGYARAYSGVSVDSFVKKITFQQISPEGLRGLGATVMEMAMAEGLQAHSAAVSIRLDKLNQFKKNNQAKMTDINLLLRDNIRKLVPYSSARHEFSGEASIFLDANENSIGSPAGNNFNRYPDPLQHRIKEQLSRIKGVPPRNIFIGHGSDECIDLLFRAFCNPGKDNVIVMPPTYGMYEVSANINDVELREVPLGFDFQPDLDAVEAAIDPLTKIIWLCSPNNPTGNAVQHEMVEVILNNFEGIVVIDEAYINFSRHQSYIRELTEYPNLVVMQTLSKAWGMAGLRMGMAFAGEPVIDVLNRVKPPYNISQATQDIVEKALGETATVNDMTRRTVAMRNELAPKLEALPGVQKVYPSDANFLLVKMDRPKEMYAALVAKGIVVRDRSGNPLTGGCLRITVGTEEENKMLLSIMERGSVKNFSAIPGKYA